MDIEEIVTKTIDCAMEVRKYFGEGYLESVYQESLLVELRHAGLQAEKEFPIKVYYKDGREVGFFKVDILVEHALIVELKAATELTPRHEMQLVNYLKCTRMETGLLINFWGPTIEIRRKYRNYKPRGSYGR